MMPNFVGVWFPRNNIEELQDFYYASMLVLLQPWRDIADLKRYDETFKQAFDKFITSADEITNIQYPHECSNSAIKKCLEQKKTEESHTILPLDGINDQLMDSDKAETELEGVLQSVSFTQHDVEHQSHLNTCKMTECTLKWRSTLL